MKKTIQVIPLTTAFVLLLSFAVKPHNLEAQTKSTQTQTKTTQTGTKPAQTTTKPAQTTTKPAQSVQTKPKTAAPGAKSTQTKPKPVQKTVKPATVKPADASAIKIGTQTWAKANLNTITFRNGDTIPEAKTNQEWVSAGESGKPAWCWYNNDPKTGLKYGRLYNWYAVNDPRGLAPAGWTLPTDGDWTKLMFYLGGQQMAGKKLKSDSGWIDGNIGSNESGFTGLPGGYRVENGNFLNIGSIGTWWSATESKTQTAVDFYLSLSGSLGRSSNPKQRGESVRCIKPQTSKIP